MKKTSTALLAIIIFLFSGLLSCQTKTVNEAEKAKIALEENKMIATLYHELNPADIDQILTEDFIGRNEKNRFTWNREDHRGWLSSESFKKDSIFQQIAEGDWVATRFKRTMDWDGRRIEVEAMHFKRFENGKIAEIWEYADRTQIETEEAAE